MLCFFQFHDDYTIYTNHVVFFIIKKQCLTRDIELIINYRVIWIPSVLTGFSLRTFSREVKVVQSCINNEKPQLISFFVYSRQSRQRLECPFKNKLIYINIRKSHSAYPKPLT